MPETIDSRSDSELLEVFAAIGDDQAFRQLAERYSGMVHLTAKRRVGSDEVAKDITQTTFATLARKAASLTSHNSLGAWLHRTTVFETRKHLRAECRHLRKMKALTDYHEQISSEQQWRLVEPFLDEAIQGLSAKDREMVFLRFFEGLSFRDLAGRVGKSEAACHKQMARALKKLSALLKGKGAVASGTVLSSVLVSHFAEASPPDYVSSLVSESVESASTVLGSEILSNTLYSVMTTKQKLLLTGLAVASISAVPMSIQHLKIKELEESNQRLLAASDPNSLVVGNGANGGTNGASAQIEHQPMDRQEMKALVSAHWNRQGAGSDGVRSLASVVENLTPENIEGLLGALNAVKASGKDTSGAERVFWGRIGEVDGERWMNASLPEHPDDPPSRNTRQCLTGWGSVDPEGVFKWYSQLEEGEYKSKLTASVLTGASYYDPKVALEFMTELPPEVQVANRNTIAQNITHHEGNAAADDWISSIESKGNPEQAELAFESLFHKMIRRNVDNAASWLSGDVAETYFDHGKKLQLVSVWAGKDPDRAAAWALSNGSPDLLTRVIDVCPPSKFNAMGEWLGLQRGEAHYQEVADTFADRIETTDPEAAAAWRSSTP